MFFFTHITTLSRRTKQHISSIPLGKGEVGLWGSVAEVGFRNVLIISCNLAPSFDKPDIIFFTRARSFSIFIFVRNDSLDWSINTYNINTPVFYLNKTRISFIFISPSSDINHIQTDHLIQNRLVYTKCTFLNTIFNWMATGTHGFTGIWLRQT